jgi:hypothetical protein
MAGSSCSSRPSGRRRSGRARPDPCAAPAPVCRRGDLRPLRAAFADAMGKPPSGMDASMAPATHRPATNTPERAARAARTRSPRPRRPAPVRMHLKLALTDRVSAIRTETVGVAAGIGQRATARLQRSRLRRRALSHPISPGSTACRCRPVRGVLRKVAWLWRNARASARRIARSARVARPRCRRARPFCWATHRRSRIVDMALLSARTSCRTSGTATRSMT